MTSANHSPACISAPNFLRLEDGMSSVLSKDSAADCGVTKTSKYDLANLQWQLRRLEVHRCMFQHGNDSASN